MEAQLRFKISNQSLLRLDGYVPTEGSDNYVHASFDVDSDNNIPNDTLAVYAVYDENVYPVYRNEETGLYDIDEVYLKYPGFYIKCQVFNEDVTRTTESVFVKVAGDGNILKRFLKSTDEYSIELLTKAYNQSIKNARDIKSINSKIDAIILALKELSNNAKSTYSNLGEMINTIGMSVNEEDTENTDENIEDVKEDENYDGLVSGDGVFIG